MSPLPHLRFLVAFVAALTVSAWTVAAQTGGRDWYVRADATGGDGSFERPFADPWQALERCEAKDRIHVTEGQYFGHLGTGTWVIPFDGVELIGGYDAQFTARDPWRRPTRLCWNAASKNWPKDVRLSSQGKHVVVDGLVVDMQDQIQYLDDARSGRTAKSSETAMRFSQPATVRNCVVINPGFHGIDCTPGSTIENNLVVNAIDWGVAVTTSTGDFARMTTVIERNTILFSWDPQKPGAGGYPGAAIALRGPATVTGNILAFSDNNAIYAPYPAETIAITGNVFWRNRFANVSVQQNGERAVADDASMELLEEIGLRAHTGNRVLDPRLAFDPEWLARTGVRDAAAAQPKPARPEPAPYGTPEPIPVEPGLAPAITFAQAIALLAPGDTTTKAGARIVPLVVAPRATAATVTAKAWRALPLADWHQRPDQVDRQALEMIVAIGSVANVGSVPSEFDQKQIAGVFLHDPDGNGARVTGFFTKGTNAERVCNDATGWYRGEGKPEKLHLVRGTAFATRGVPKAAFLIESIERYEPAVASTRVRAKGRDWFVRAGATDGDGTRERPFRDPFQALERCEAGDRIHVAGGEYHGRLKAGRWVVDMPDIALLGGYDATFATRSPWEHPTRLLCPADFKGRRGGYTLEGADDHQGTVVDGFVFDKTTNNVYLANGTLHVGHSDKTEHIWLSKPDCEIRNCVFSNGAEGALRVANGHVIENNVFVNHFTQTIAVQSGHTTNPIVIRGNTVLFAWTVRFGAGHGANGHLLHLGSRVRAVVEGNVFAYADNDAIRLDADPREITLRGNAFGNNLWSNVHQASQMLTFDDENWHQLADLGWKVCDGNVLTLPPLAIDAEWAAMRNAVRAVSKAATATAPTPETPPGNPFLDGSTPPATPPPAPAAPSRNPFDTSAPAAPTPAATDPAIAPRYPLPATAALFAKEPTTIFGARVVPIVVTFDGVTRDVVTHEYAPTTWEIAKNAASWDAMAGQRVRIEVAIQRLDTMFQMPGVTAEDHVCFLAGGPDGPDSGGLPLRCYVRKGTRDTRVLQQAKGYATTRPEQRHVLCGVVGPRRQLLVESIERLP